MRQEPVCPGRRLDIMTKKRELGDMGHKKALSLLVTGLQRIWQLPTLPHCGAVPSAMRGLTSLFGMGRGEHPRQNHHKILNERRLHFRSQ